MENEMGESYQLLYSVKIIRLAQYRPTGYPFLPIAQFLFFA